MILRLLSKLSSALLVLICCGGGGGRKHPSRYCLVVALQPLASSSTAATTSQSPPTKVLVTGASGRTGQLVFAALLQDDRFEPKALVRSVKSAKKLRKAVPGSRIDQIVICDVTSLATTDRDQQPVSAMEGCQAMVICTSAVPTISKVSLLRALLKAPFNLLTGRKAMDFRSLKFVWQNKQYPELVDYHGQVSQIDLARHLQMRHVVVVSSMGGTDPTNFLNSVGKNADGTGNGDILMWKRKAERYLVASDLDYTIIHPGGLIDTPAGVEEFVLDVNDDLMLQKKRSISREDVANLCVAALVVHSDRGSTGQKVALDCITIPASPGTTVRTPEQALRDFLQQSKVYDYSL
jgi:uncharacterized protein YbjT (DUF2867 family)